MLKSSLAGLAGLTLPDLLRARAAASQTGIAAPSGKSVILLWMAGGPSHIDTWDPKPNQPLENRGPFGVTQTKLPGVTICEHLPKQASMLDKFTIIRSVDARNSNHEPNKVMQTANLEAEPRINRNGDMYPAIGSIIAKHHGANRDGVPAYAAFMKSRSHVAYAGYLGKKYDPFIANDAVSLPIYTDVGVDTGAVSDGAAFRLPQSLSHERLYRRMDLVRVTSTRCAVNWIRRWPRWARSNSRLWRCWSGAVCSGRLICPRNPRQHAIATVPTCGANRRC
jgi:hypothetical protein